MIDPKAPRNRAARLRPEALAALEAALDARWGKDRAHAKRLTWEDRKDLLGVQAIATARKILANEGVDRSTLKLAFERLDLPWSEGYLEPPTPVPEPAPADADLEEPPPPPETKPKPYRRLAIAGTLAVLILATAGWMAHALTAPATAEDWGLACARAYDEGLALYHRGDYKGAHAPLERALDIARRHDSAEKMSLARGLAGNLAGAEGDLQEVKKEYEEAWRLRDQLHEEFQKPSLEEALGDVETRLGEYDAAEAHLLSSMEGYRRFGDPVGVVLAQRDLGSVALGKGDLDGADDWLRQGLAGLRRVSKSQPDIVADILSRQALVLLERDHPQEARTLLQGCLDHWSRKGQPRWIALTEMQLALTEERLDLRDAARERLARSLDAFGRIGDRARYAEVAAHRDRLSSE